MMAQPRDLEAATAEGQVADRFRDRSRSVAGLTAAAAGALTIALYSTAVVGLPAVSVVLGVAAAILLAVATACFSSASVVYPEQRVLPAVQLLPWIVRLPPGMTDPAQMADQAIRRIKTLTNVGLLAAGAALLPLLIAVCFTAAAAGERATAVVTFKHGAPVVAPCGQLASVVRGTMPESALTVAGPISLRLDPRFCRGSAVPVEVVIQRSDIELAVPQP